MPPKVFFLFFSFFLKIFIYLAALVFVAACSLLFFFKLINFVYFWLHWVFVAACGLSLVAVMRLWWCAGLSLRWPLLLQSTVSRALAVVARRPSSCGSRAL